MNHKSSAPVGLFWGDIYSRDTRIKSSDLAAATDKTSAGVHFYKEHTQLEIAAPLCPSASPTWTEER